MRRKRFKIVNVDVTLVAQRPKLSPHYPAMRASVAGLLKLAESDDQHQGHHHRKARLGWRRQGNGRDCGGFALSLTVDEGPIC